MPDVGSLNIEITSNAAEAAAGLGTLAKKLGSVNEKAQSFDLTKVKTNITNIVNAVKGSEKTMSSLGTLFNATATYFKTFGKITSAVKINVEPIKQLKEAIGDGIKVGIAGSQINQLRTALEGEWKTDNAYNAGFALSAIAEGAKAAESTDISKVANDIRDLADSINVYTDATDRSKNAIGTTSSAINEVKKEAEATEGTMTRLQQLMGKRANIQLFGGTDSASTDWRSALMGQGDFVAGVETETAKLKEIVTQIQVTDAVMQKVADNVSAVGDRFSSAISEEAVISPIRMISESFREAEKYIRYYESGIDAILPKINQLSSEHMIEAGNAKLAAMSEKELRVAILDAQGELSSARIMSPVQLEQVQNVQQFNIELQETGDIIQSVIIPRFAEMYQIWSMFAYEFGAFQMQAARLTAGSTPLFLGDGRTPGQLLLGDGSEPETFLSTWVRVGEEFKTNWVMFTSDVAEQWRAQWSPDFVLGGWNVPQSMSTFHIGAGESPLLLGDGGVSPDNMLSTFVDTSEQWKQNWIVGEGFVSDVIDETETVTSETQNAAKEAEAYAGVFEKILEAKKEEAALANEANRKIEAEFNYGNMKTAIQVAKEARGISSQDSGISEQTKDASIFSSVAERLSGVLGKLKDRFAALRSDINESGGSFAYMKSKMSALFPTLSSLGKRFKSIIIMRSLRYVIRQIAAGFSEGVQNVYQYSKAVGTDLAPAMDQAATALQQMKNSIGAAVAPAIQAVVPVLQTVVNWLITVINYLNQFFALMRGQSTWTRALPEQAEAFEKSTKSAKGASKAMKDLLADWDELNIIQSQGGGGTGSAAAEKAEEYKNMFEEVSEFDQSVKDVLGFIEDHLGGLPGILKKAGAIILGWKLSKAFSGFLGSLGKLIAGGALLVLGIELDYGSGFSAGSKGFFDGKDIIGTIAGTLASAIGGSLLTSAAGFGGPVGFVIGIGVGIVATLWGYVQGQADLMDKMKWGNIELTPEQLAQYVKSKFTFDIEAEINVLKANVDIRKEAGLQLSAALNKFTTNYDAAKIKVGMKADDAGTAVEAAGESALRVIDQVNEYIKTSQKTLTTTFSISPVRDEFDNDVTEDVLSHMQFAESTLNQYFEDMGADIAAAIDRGKNAHWEGNTMEEALKLMQHERDVIARAEELDKELTFEIDFSMNLKGLTRDNAKEVFEQEKQLIEDYKKAFMEDRETAKQMAIKELAWTEAAIEDYKAQGRDTTELEQSKAYLNQLINDYLDPEAAEQAWKDKMSESMARMRGEWIEALKGVYGITVSDIEKPGGFGTYRSAGMDLWEDLENASQSDDAFKAGKKALETYFEYWKNMQPDYIKDVMEEFGFTVWDLADDGVKEGIVNAVREHMGNDDLSAAILQSLGVSIDEVERLFGNGYKYNQSKFSPVSPNKKNTSNQGNNPFAYTPADFSNLPIGTVFEFADTVPITAPIGADVEFHLNEDQVRQDLIDKVNAALEDGNMSYAERTALNLAFGEDFVNAVLEELQYNLDEEGYNRGSVRPVGMVARAGVSDVGWAPYHEPAQSFVGESGGVPLDMEAEVDGGLDEQGVATGVQNGTKDINEALGSILRGVNALLNKQWVVNVTPNAAWGGFNSRSNREYEKVTG